MNATEREALLQGFELHDEMTGIVDERTLEILDQRRRNATVWDPGAVEELFEVMNDRTRELLESRAGIAGWRRRGWLVRRALFLADLLGLMIAFALAQRIYAGRMHQAGSLDGLGELLAFVVSLPVWVVAAKFYGLYGKDEEQTDHSTIDDFPGVFHLVTVCTFFFFALSRETHWFSPEFGKLLLFWAFASLGVTLCRAGARAYCRRQLDYVQNTIIVGAGEVGQLVARKLLKHSEYGLNLVGFVDGEPCERRADLDYLTVLGGPDRLPELIELLDVERVIVAFSADTGEELVKLVRSLVGFDVQIDIVPRLFDVVGPRATLHTIEGLPLVGLPPARPARSSRLLKRALDVVGSTLGLAVTAPLFLYIGLRIKLSSDGPVFFRQTRLTTDMQPFTVLKFRTMEVGTTEVAHRDFVKATLQRGAAPALGGLFKAEQNDRVTSFGRWLRKTSLDELPQLVNVLRGDMSLVGPRPSLPYEVENFELHHFERFGVRAGITGLWQVTARTHSTWAEALDLDVMYVRNWSFKLDLWLLARTPFQIFRLRTY